MKDITRDDKLIEVNYWNNGSVGNWQLPGVGSI